MTAAEISNRLLGLENALQMTEPIGVGSTVSAAFNRSTHVNRARIALEQCSEFLHLVADLRMKLANAAEIPSDLGTRISVELKRLHDFLAEVEKVANQHGNLVPRAQIDKVAEEVVVNFIKDKIHEAHEKFGYGLERLAAESNLSVSEPKVQDTDWTMPIPKQEIAKALNISERNLTTIIKEEKLRFRNVEYRNVEIHKSDCPAALWDKYKRAQN